MAAQPIRVLHVITWMDAGGAQAHVLDLLRTDDPELDIAVASGSNRGDPGPLEAEFASAGSLYRLQHLRRELSVRDIAAILEIRSLIRRLQPDVVHTHSSKAGVLGRLATIGLPVKTVHNVHGWSFSPMKGLGRRAVVLLEQVLARLTDVLVTVSHADAEAARANRIRPRRGIEMIRSGIELSVFRAAARSEARTQSSSPILGTVGRVATQKDPMAALEVLAGVRRVVPDAQFHWIGDGPLRRQVEVRARELGLESSFKVLGHVNDVASQLSSLDVFLLCSRWEGLPRGLVEAMACEVPVVAASVDGVPDVVVEGVTGHLVPPGDTHGLTRAVVDSVQNPADARKMAQAALGRLDEFSVEETRRRTGQLYRSLV